MNYGDKDAIIARGTLMQVGLAHTTHTVYADHPTNATTDDTNTSSLTVLRLTQTRPRVITYHLGLTEMWGEFPHRSPTRILNGFLEGSRLITFFQEPVGNAPGKQINKRERM